MNEPRLDVAALLAREAVALDRSPQTEGTLLQTLLRSPAVVGTFSLPTSSTPHVAVSPDGRTLAVSDSAPTRCGSTTPYPPPSGRTLAISPAISPRSTPATGRCSCIRRGHSSRSATPTRSRCARGSRSAHRLREEITADIPEGSILIGPGRRTVYYAYWLMNAAGQPTDAYLNRWSLPSGRRLPALQIGSGPLLALRLVDRGAASWSSPRTKSNLRCAHTGAGALGDHCRCRVLPSAAAISPDGGTITIGSKTGSVSFVDAATGRAGAVPAATRPSRASSTRPMARPHDRGRRGQVIVWDPGTAHRGGRLRVPPATCRARRSVPTARLCTPRPSGARCWHGISRANEASAAVRGWRQPAMLRSPLSARARAGGICGRVALRGPDRHLDRRGVLDGDARAAGDPSPSRRGVTRSRRSRGRPPARRSPSARTADSSSSGPWTAARC